MERMTLRTMGGITLMVVCSLLTPTKAEILYAETAAITFDVWAADLRPGYYLKEKSINDRLCYCKKPSPSSSTSSYLDKCSYSSFYMNTPPVLSSSGTPASSFEYIFLTFPAGRVMPDRTGFNATSGGQKPTIACGDCNMEVTIDDSNYNSVHQWASPGWQENLVYPDGCNCTLVIHVRLSGWGNLVYTFAEDSSIVDINNCTYDRLETDFNGIKNTWCGTDLATKSGSVLIHGEEEELKFTFISDPNDGNTKDSGLHLTIKMQDYDP